MHCIHCSLLIVTLITVAVPVYPAGSRLLCDKPNLFGDTINKTLYIGRFYQFNYTACGYFLL